jgi:hypothetical protein
MHTLQQKTKLNNINTSSSAIFEIINIKMGKAKILIMIFYLTLIKLEKYFSMDLNDLKMLQQQSFIKVLTLQLPHL